jgi:D-alanine-D-alanine ligase
MFYTVCMSTVIVLAGDNSSEREVSLRSGAAVAKALRTNGHTVTMIDPAEDFAARKSEVQAADAVFPALHGKGGEDGEIQAVLESWHVAYVGSDAAASRLCFDKWQFETLMRAHHVLMPAGELLDFAAFKHSELAKKPFVLKPFDGGSSVDTLIVRDVSQFDAERAREVFARNPRMLLENLIDGIEITVGILGDQPLPVVEIIPPTDGEFDYENKYNGQSQELCPPQHVGAELQQKAQAISLRAHQLAGCRDFSRSDFIVTESGEAYLLETNTIPGLTDQSLFPKAAATSGLSMPEAIEKLLQFALARRG